MESLDFTNHVLYVWNLFGMELLITETIRNTWIIMGVLILLALVVRIMLATNNFKETPTGFQNLIEMGIEVFDNFVSSTMGKKYRYFGNWFFTVFLFILLSNYSGLFGLRAPTADLGTTLMFALVTFILIHGSGIATQGLLSYIKGTYLEPIPIFLPMNIIGELARPISLSFRLFGNLLGGTVIMGMIYALPFFVKIGIPAVLHIYFDLFSGAIQAFIFTILSMTFIASQLGSEE